MCNLKGFILVLVCLFSSITANATPPIVVSTEITSATEDAIYSYSMSGTDADNDTLTWTGDLLPNWLSIDQGSDTTTDFGGVVPGPGGVATDSYGNTYIAELVGSTIYKISPAGIQTSFTTVSTSNKYGMLVVGSNLYISYYFLNKITKVDLNNPAAGESTYIASIIDPLAMIEKDGFIYVAQFFANKVSKINLIDDSVSDYVTGTPSPFGIGFSSKGDLYIASFINKYISKFSNNTLTTNIKTLANNISDVKIDDNDYIFVSTFEGGVKKISPDLSVVQDISQAGRVWGMTVNSSNTLIWGINDLNKLVKLETEVILTGTPINDDIGIHDVNITLSDGSNDVAHNFQVNVSNSNDAPTDIALSNNPIGGVNPGGVVGVLSTFDIDPGPDTFTYSVVANGASGNGACGVGNDAGNSSFEIDNTIIKSKVNSNLGNYKVCVQSSDGAASYQETFSITIADINVAPVISGIPATSVDEDTIYIFTPTVTDGDSGDSKTFSIINKPIWATFSSVTGALMGTPVQADIGTTSGVIISVKDSGNASVSLTAFNIIVFNTNDEPVISGIPGGSVAENSEYNFTPIVVDVDTGDSKTFSIINQPTWATFSTSIGALIGTPVQADIGTSSGIIISVKDSGNASVSLPAFNIIVSNTNDAPVISGIPAASVAENSAYSFTPIVVDIDSGDSKTFSITNKPIWATFSTSTGVLSGTPSSVNAADYNDIIISVSDSANESASLPAFIITVTNTNEAPVAEAQTHESEEDHELTIILHAEDADEDELTYAIVTEPVNGVLVKSTYNTWAYTPEENYNGTDSFTYKAIDAQADSEPATVELAISAVNDAPIAQNDKIVLTYSESGRYVLDVLNNDIDVDFDVLSIIKANSSIGTTSIGTGQLIYQMQGVFEGAVELQYVISDGNTVTDNNNSKGKVTLVFDSHIDALLPVITLPGNINIDAMALFTKVDLGVATAINNTGDTIPVSLVDGNTRFAPGNSLVYWQAQDNDGFQRFVTQSVTVQPLINIAKDSQGSEGEHYKVAVHLNGESPNYPVIVSYTVSGEADSRDHDLVSGELVIDSGLVGYIEFDIFNDTEVEVDEMVVITLAGLVNLGTKSVFTLTITEDNIAPQVSITVSQNSEKRTLIDKNLGEVVISSDVFDNNNDDNHSYTWTSVSGELVDSDADDTSFTFAPISLATGKQILSLTVTDDADTPLSIKAFVYLDIIETLPTLTSMDSDGDLIPDNTEGYGDTDNDGIADYLDNNNSRCNVQVSEVSEHDLYLIETESSTCLRRGINTASNESGSLLLSVNEVINDNDAINIGGIFDFILSGLPVAGQSISLVLPQRLPIPENAIYRKLTPDNGWSEFTVDVNNYYSSAAGEIGYCPVPNDDSWTIGLTAGHWCVQVTIEDGGLNDDDGVANSRIVDPSGVAILNNDNALPVIMSEQIETTQNKSITIDVLANDTDSDGDRLSITSANVDFGSAFIVDQQLLYEPDTHFFGLAIISYGVSDDNNGTGYGDVSVNVVENTAPVTTNDDASTDNRTAITIDVLVNDTDIDNDDLTLISANAEQGSLVINNNRLIYTPLAGFVGVDTIIYHIDDNNGGENQGQVIITINAYESINITNKSSGGSFGPVILMLGSVMLFIRQTSTLIISKADTGKTLTKYLSLLALLSLNVSVISHAAQASTLDFLLELG